MMSKKTVHPLFDPKSLYGRAAEASLWHDHGEKKMQGFFEALRRERLRPERDAGSVPDFPQDSSMSDELNRKDHEVLCSTEKSSATDSELIVDVETRWVAGPGSQEQKRKPAVVEGLQNTARRYDAAIDTPLAARNDAAVDFPVTVIFDLREVSAARPIDLLDTSEGRFTGSGKSCKGELSSEFDVNIPLNKFHMAEPVQKNARCRFLIFRPSLLGVLKELFDKDPGEFKPVGEPCGLDFEGRDILDRVDAIDIIRQLVSDPLILGPCREEIEACRKAFWLSAMLKTAPGVEGNPVHMGADEWFFEKSVLLRQASPVLEGLVIGALFIGP